MSGALSASRSFSKEDLEEILARDLLYRYGPLLGQEELWRALGYMSLDGLRQAGPRNCSSPRIQLREAAREIRTVTGCGPLARLSVPGS